MVKRSQNLVDILNCLIGDLIHHKVIIVESKPVIQLNDVAIQTLTDVNCNVLKRVSRIFFFQYHLRLWQVNIEIVNASL